MFAGVSRSTDMGCNAFVEITDWRRTQQIADGPEVRGCTSDWMPRREPQPAQVAGLSEKVVWQLLQPYATAGGVHGIAPHDLGRSCAKMCRTAVCELEQIQLLLRHAYVAPSRISFYLGLFQGSKNSDVEYIRR